MVFYDSRLDDWNSNSFELSIDDLDEKFGFQDGAVFEYFCEAFPELPWYGELLEDVVPALILPALNKKIEVYKPNSSHNPVRVVGGASVLEGIEPKIVTISALDILKHYGIDKLIADENKRLAKIKKELQGENMEINTEKKFKTIKARYLKTGDVLKAPEADGELVKVTGVNFIAAEEAADCNGDRITYSCKYGFSGRFAEEDIEILIEPDAHDIEISQGKTE